MNKLILLALGALLGACAAPAAEDPGPDVPSPAPSTAETPGFVQDFIALEGDPPAITQDSTAPSAQPKAPTEPAAVALGKPEVRYYVIADT